MDTAAGDMVSVSVSADGPYGVMFEADQDGHAAVVRAFDRLPNGKFGPIQKHGGIHIGDVMYAINDSKMDVVAHREVMQIVRDRNLLKKTFKFMNVNEYYRKKKSKETHIDKNTSATVTTKSGEGENQNTKNILSMTISKLIRKNQKSTKIKNNRQRTIQLGIIVVRTRTIRTGTSTPTRTSIRRA